MIVLVLHQGLGHGFLRADLAGRPFASHLPTQLRALRAERTAVIDTRNPFPGQPSSIEPGFIAGEDLLLVADNAWFSTGALEALLILISKNVKVPRYVCEAARNIDAVDEPGALAIFLPEPAAAAFLGDLGSSVFGINLASIARGLKDCDAVLGPELDSVLPPIRIKNFLDMANLERRILNERAHALLLAGVRIRDPHRVNIRGELHCASGVEIDVGVIIEGTVILGEGVRIGANSILIRSTIGANTRVNPFSIVEDAVVGSNCFVGPYGRVRPGSKIGDSVQIGNFVEIKNSAIGSASRINHLAFIGDATLETNVTIGAGSITCNHDGVGVSHTEIGAGAYVGSGCKLVAPLTIGRDATIGAGSTITQDVPAGKLTLARSRQITVENWTRPDKKLTEK